jgi:hypothetical protein
VNNRLSHRDPLSAGPYLILRSLFLKSWHRFKGRLKDLALDHLQVTDQEIGVIGPVLQRIIWSEPSVRRRIQEYGANVTPINFYSNTPSFKEIDSSFEYIGPQPPYLSDSLFDSALLIQTLNELMEYSFEFNPVVEGDEKVCDSYFWRNGQFGYSDATSYYCFVRKLKPRTIVEIGSGFSTLIAIEAVKKNETGQVICVEPFPRPFLERSSDIRLVRKTAQEIDSDYLNETLQDGDILFIDSTHTVKTGSDCLHIYLRLLPNIKRNIYVHVHDVFLPFGMPKEWLMANQIFWTEQYLLLALLLDNPKARVLFGSAYHSFFNKELLERLMNNRYPSGGGSFWFEYEGSTNSNPSSADPNTRVSLSSTV